MEEEVLIETLCHFENKKKKNTKWFGHEIQFKDRIFRYFFYGLLVNDIVNFLYTFTNEKFWSKKSTSQNIFF